MIISDLNHLEVVSEASSVVGGGSYKYGKFDYTKKVNLSLIKQDATAVAISYDGDAKATATNVALVGQSN